MAETLNFPVTRGSVLRITDATGTPKTYDITLTEGTVEIANAGFEEHRMHNTDGDLGAIVKKGRQTGESTISVNTKIFDPGDNSTEAVLMDVVNASGYFASDWATTGDTNADFKQFTIALIIPASGGGKTYTLTKAHAKSGYTISAAPDGFTVAITFASHEPKVTIS